MEKFLVDSILDTIPSEVSGCDSILSKDIDEYNSWVDNKWLEVISIIWVIDKFNYSQKRY